MLVFLVGGLIFLGLVSFRGYVPGGSGIQDTWELTHYANFLLDAYHMRIMGRSIYISFTTVICCLVLAFPLAYLLSELRGTARAILYICILLPLLTSTVVRTFGWMVLLSSNGLVNQGLIAIGLVERPIAFMYSDLGIIIALTEVLLPFMILAIDAALLNIDRNLYDAARNLGAGAARIFFSITLPLTVPGIVSGSILVFSLAVSAYVTPDLIGGPRNPVMAMLIYQQGVSMLNWPFAAAISFILLALVLLAAAIALRVKVRI
ncbi:ABC transporter permease [Mesorhizobium sp.]|uniref:ABC transporter permease n=1 Tax=Mesorhizobium sp. TaxID=1871066 RepID=UPI0026015C64|nr:ABC transporter permease [Mesorhizobium sp.]